MLRRGPDGRARVALVHRPRYGDWSLPKGKLDGGETSEDAALREVHEETGLRCRLIEELPPVAYRDAKGRGKQVRYWLMTVEAEPPPFEPTAEVDEVRWLDAAEALERLSYERDRELLREALRRFEAG